MESETAREVVLVTDTGEPCGVALKNEVHSSQTPLHLGFSCHVIDSLGQVLVTRRSLRKRTWPGVWSNSFCGHPQPEERLEDAVRRHAQHELGLTLGEISPALPEFRYHATDSSGVVEHEICPVFTATTLDRPLPNPEEVEELSWTSAPRLRAAVDATPWAFSPWLALQIPQMPLYQSQPHPTDIGQVQP